MTHLRPLLVLVLVASLSIPMDSMASTPVSDTVISAQTQSLGRAIPPGETGWHTVWVNALCRGPYLPHDDVHLFYSVQADVEWLDLHLSTYTNTFTRDGCLNGWREDFSLESRIAVTKDAPAWATGKVTLKIETDDPNVSPQQIQWQVKAGLAGAAVVELPAAVSREGPGTIEVNGTLHNDANGPLYVWTSLADVPDALIVQPPAPVVVNGTVPIVLRLYAVEAGIHTFTLVHHPAAADAPGIVLDAVETTLVVVVE